MSQPMQPQALEPTPKNRFDLKYGIIYSFHAETLVKQRNQRVANLINATQLFLGVLIATIVVYCQVTALVLGLAVSLLSVLSIVFKFSEKAVSASAQARQYKELMLQVTYDEFDVELVKQQFRTINATDSDTSFTIKLIAELVSREQLANEIEPNTGATLPTLSRWQEVIKWFAGY